jgi:transposase
MRNAPEMIDVDTAQLQEVLQRAEQALDAKDAELIRAVFQSYAYVAGLVDDKNTSIRRLRQLFFGARTEKTEAVVGRKTDEPVTTGPEGVAAEAEVAAGDAEAATAPDADPEPAAPGHGRHGADAYRGAARVNIPHPSLTAGDPCPACGQGTVYDKAPGVVVRLTGQPPLAATVYQLHKLRCHLCG